jgi:hypothetical protein
MKGKSIKVLMMVLAAVIGFSTSPAFSDEKSTDTMQIVREKIKADKKLLVAMNMNLTESEAAKFWPLYEDYQKTQDAVFARFGKLIDEYTSNYQQMTDEKASRLLDEYLFIEADLVSVRKSYQYKFRAILPDIKVVRYYQIENKIQAVVRYDLAANIPLLGN